MSSVLFRDRHDAGMQLTQAVLKALSELTVPQFDRVVVYALPKGGLPVAEPLAQALNCPLNVVVAKKMTRPDNPELAIGAVTADGYIMRSRRNGMFQPSVAGWHDALKSAHYKAREQLEQLQSICPPVNPVGALALLVDDGIATGMTVAVAARSLQTQRPALLWICAPVAPTQICQELEDWSDRLILLAAPDPFFSVSHFYERFEQVEMEEAIACLQRHNQHFLTELNRPPA